MGPPAFLVTENVEYGRDWAAEMWGKGFRKGIDGWGESSEIRRRILRNVAMTGRQNEEQGIPEAKFGSRKTRKLAKKWIFGNSET